MSNKNEDYVKAGFNGTLEFGKNPALLIVDVVNAYIEPCSPLYAGSTAITALENNVRLRAAAHNAGIPIIMTNVIYHDSGIDGCLFYKKGPLFYKKGPCFENL